MNAQPLVFVKIVAELGTLYDDPPLPVSDDAFELVVWENVAYLVNDERRKLVFERLRHEVGIDPDAILNCPTTELARLIRDGGMQPERRADKLQTAAKIAVAVGPEKLISVMQNDHRAAKTLLKRFPGIGEPGADKILLFTHSAFTLAPESNAVRVLVRLGFAEDSDDYGRTYRTLMAVLEPLLPHDYNWLIRAHQLLRLHGQTLCKRSTPHCEVCPLTAVCGWYRRSQPT